MPDYSAGSMLRENQASRGDAEDAEREFNLRILRVSA
jgi:hypothetical protein